MAIPRGPESDGALTTHAPIPQQVVRADSPARLSESANNAGHQHADFDRRLVRDSFAHLMSDPHQAMEYMYGRLFAASPELRSLFPLTMTQTRAAVFRMLARLFWSIENPQATEEALARLAVSHRKFGVREAHYLPFFEALLATVESCADGTWTAQTLAAWHAAISHFGEVMTMAATKDSSERAAWWTCEVVQHELRADSIAVLSVRPDRPLTYLPGQYISVQVPRWPRIWRDYSVANAPRDNGLLDIHVRAVPGGLVSTALVSHCGTGETLILGAARGRMAVVPDNGRDLVCVAGGTGLAPMKAITESVVAASGQGRRREVTVYFGVRRGADLYDTRDLETLRLAYPSLTLIPVVEDEPDFPGRTGRLPEVLATHPSFRDCDVYVAGPAAMISATIRALSTRVPADRLHHDPLDALWQASRPPRPVTGRH